MIFCFLLFDGVTGLPRVSSADLMRDNKNVGQISKYSSSSCPKSKSNRCDIKRGTLFSRSRCEWLNYFEECALDGSDKCYGYFDNSMSEEIWWNLSWEACDDSVINEIRNLFPGVTLDFETFNTWHGRSCLPTIWSGPETCDPVLEKGSLIKFDLKLSL